MIKVLIILAWRDGSHLREEGGRERQRERGTEREGERERGGERGRETERGKGVRVRPSQDVSPEKRI
jgi:hypothetical protein